MYLIWQIEMNIFILSLLSLIFAAPSPKLNNTLEQEGHSVLTGAQHAADDITMKEEQVAEKPRTAEVEFCGDCKNASSRDSCSDILLTICTVVSLGLGLLLTGLYIKFRDSHTASQGTMVILLMTLFFTMSASSAGIIVASCIKMKCK